MSAMGPPPPSLGPPRRNAMRRAAGDLGVQKTNDDAQSTKMSCASLGYFSDDLLPLLAKCLPSRKPPLINRGTWARYVVMRQVITDFITACVQQQQQQQQQAATVDNSSNGRSLCQPVCQVVVLGAGSDSSWFNMQQQGWELLPAVRYIELDYPEVVSKKARAVLSTDKLLQLLPDGTMATSHPAAAAAGQQPFSAVGQSAAAATGSAGPVSWTKHSAPAPGGSQQHPPCHQQQQQQQQQQEHHCSMLMPPAVVAAHAQELLGSQYSCVGMDLRHPEQYQAALQRAHFDASLHTLYLSECVLVYLEPSEAEQLLEVAAACAASAGSSAAVAIYEQTRPNDAFGCTMISNLEARGCPLRSVLSVPTPTAQQQRLLSRGWATAAAADMAAVYYGSSRSSSSSGSWPAAAVAGDCGWLREQWQQERRRIERLEPLDELEEWRLLQEHYCLALGVVGDGSAGDVPGWLAQELRLTHLRALGGDELQQAEGA